MSWSLFEAKPTITASPFPHGSTKVFANDKGATALMMILAPGEAETELDGGAQLLETIAIAPDALRTLAAERARTVRAYLLQTGKVEAQRITEATPVAGSKGSRVYVRLR
jgi:hypothetical protein